MRKQTLTLIIILCNILTYGINAQNQIGSVLNGDSNGTLFGSAISISEDGNRVAVGAALFVDTTLATVGSVKIYEWTSGDWMQMGNNITGSEDFAFIGGNSISLSSDGSTIAIGGTMSTNSFGPNKVKIFEWTGVSWIQKGNEIIGEAIEDSFGYSLALSSDGNYIVSGGINNDENGTNSGHVRVHTYFDGDWIQVGEDINGESAGDRAGGSVDISSDGSKIAIGAAFSDGNDGTQGNSGSVRIFEWTDSAWTQMGNNINGEAIADRFGGSLSLSSDGTRVAVGAVNSDGNAANAGHVRVFEWVNEDWEKLGEDLDGTNSSDRFGQKVSLSDDGNRLAIGAPLNDEAFEDGGQVKIFEWINSAWIPLGMSLEGEKIKGWFGVATTISGNGERLIVSARNFDDFDDDQGIARVYDLSGPTDVTSIKIASPLFIYPNPCTNELFLQNDKIEHIQIFDIYGAFVKEVKSYPITKIDVSDLISGVYYLNFTLKEFSVTKKFIKVN